MAQRLILTTQQSHHCGIETLILHTFNPTEMCSNRTIVGLKLKARAMFFYSELGSNRTIVGLKPAHTMSVTTSNTCSNRTIVGLKH